MAAPIPELAPVTRALLYGNGMGLTVLPQAYGV
jgi:hypothetical protein